MSDSYLGNSTSPFISVEASSSTPNVSAIRKPTRRLACAECRVRKVKCSGPTDQDPSRCAACIGHGRVCEWPIRRRPKRKREGQEGDNEESIPNPLPTTSSSMSYTHTISTPGHMHSPPIPTSSDADTTPLTQNLLPHTHNLSYVSSASPINMGFHAGHQETTSDVKVHYHRVSGNTAVHPGVNRISLKLRKKSEGRLEGAGQIAEAVVMFDMNTDLPLPHIYDPILVLFFQILGQHFPSIDPTLVYKRIANRTMPSFLLNAICAVAARFQHGIEGQPAKAGNPFMAKALQHLVPLLRLPSTDTVTGLLLLAWAEFGQNYESGHWQFAGLAIRMAIDLGLHRHVDALYEGEEHARRLRDLFWSVFLTDRLVSMNAGRACSIPIDNIDVPLPPTDGPASHPLAFLYSVQLMEKVGRIGDLLNGSRGTPGTFWTPSASPMAMADALKSLQESLVAFYNNLPDHVSWSAENFQREAGKHHGGIFLFFHLWANAMISLTYHPAVLHKPRGTDTPLTQRMDHSMELAIASSRNVCEYLALAEAVLEVSYTGTPQVTQALYFAGLAFAYQLRLLQAAEPATSAFTMTSTTSQVARGSNAMLDRLARQNLQNIIKTLGRIEVYWAGAGPVKNVLQQRANGLRHAFIDFTSDSEAPESFLYTLTNTSSPLAALNPNRTSTAIDTVNSNLSFNGSGSEGGGPGLSTDSWSWQNFLSGSSAPDIFGDVIQPFAPLPGETDFSTWMSSNWPSE